MRILCENSLGANHYIGRSYANAFHKVGHEVVWWNTDGKSAYDVFAESGPFDLAFLHSWKLNRALVKNLLAAPATKIVLRVPHWGSADADIDTEKYPIQFATDEEKRFVEQLVKDHPNLKLGFCQYHNSRIANTHDLWKNIGLDVYGILLSADVTQYFKCPKNPAYDVDIFYCGNYWKFKGESIDPYLMPLLYPHTNLTVKIVGGGGWNVPNYLGQATEETIRNFYSNAKIVPALFEPHTKFLPDLPQRIYETAACGGFQIAQTAVGLEDVFDEGEIVTADSPQDFLDKVDYYYNHQDETIPFRENGMKKVLTRHTNFHRACQLLQMIDEPVDTLEKIISQIHFDLTGY